MFVHAGFAIENASKWLFLVNSVCCKTESASREKQSSFNPTDI